MTVQEAIAEIENMLIVVKHDCDSLNQEYENKTLEALTLAYEALKKQVPMKPKHYGSVPHARCGNCGNAVKIFNDGHECHHCLYCGQRLDWSEENGN